MKRNFLLMLLMTLLPLAGWAQGPDPGDEYMPPEHNQDPVVAAIYADAQATEYQLAFTSLAEAFEACQAEQDEGSELGNYIRVLSEAVVNNIILVTKEVTLDLNGQTIKLDPTASTAPEEFFVVRRGAVFTVTDTSVGEEGLIDASDCMLAIKMTNADDTTEAGYALGKAKLVVNAGTIVGDQYGISGNGNSKRDNTEVVINGGTIMSRILPDRAAAKDATGIYQPQAGTLTINGGVIKGYKSAVEVRSGVLVINKNTNGDDPSLQATCANYDVQSNHNGATTWGAALAIAQHTTKKAISVTINGGTFNGARSLSVADPEGNQPNDIAVSVTGGTFEGNVESIFDKILSGGLYTPYEPNADYVADGYMAVKKATAAGAADYFEIVPVGDLKWTISPSSNVYTGYANPPANIKVNGVPIDQTNFAVQYTEQLTGKVVEAPVHAGTYTLKLCTVEEIENIGGYNSGVEVVLTPIEGVATKTYTINKKSSLSLDFCQVKMKYGDDETTIMPDWRILGNVGDDQEDDFIVEGTGYVLRGPAFTGVDIVAGTIIGYTTTGDPHAYTGRIYEQATDPETGELLFDDNDEPVYTDVVVFPGYEDYNVKVLYASAQLIAEPGDLDIDFDDPDDDDDNEDGNDPGSQLLWSNGTGKIYGEADDFRVSTTLTETEVDGQTVQEHDGNITVTDQNGNIVKIKIEREAGEDVGEYQLTATVLEEKDGEDVVSTNYVFSEEDATPILNDENKQTGKWILKQNYKIGKRDLNDAKVLIAIEDPTYDATLQQIVPEEVLFYDEYQVFKKADGTYAPGYSADNYKEVEGKGYVILKQDKAAVADDNTTPDVDESAPAVVGDWTLAWLKADGTGTQKNGENATTGEWTYNYNRSVARDADGKVLEGENAKGECQIAATVDVEDNEETTDVDETSVKNFFGYKVGNFAMQPAPLSVKVKDYDGPFPGANYNFGIVLDDVVVEGTTKYGWPEAESTGTRETVLTNLGAAVTAYKTGGDPATAYGYNVSAAVGENVSISVKDAAQIAVNVILAASNYDLKFAAASSTIDAIILKFKPVTQQLKYSDFVIDNKYTKPTINTTVTLGTPDLAETDADYVAPTVELTTSAALPADFNITDFFSAINQSTTKACKKDGDNWIANAGALTLAPVTDAVAPAGYLVQSEPGDLIIEPLTEMHLSYPDMDQALEDHKGFVMDKVYMPNRKLVADTWYTFVLPFEFTAPEFDAKVSYEVIDVLDENTTDGNVHFVTTVGTVEANQPFLVKINAEYVSPNDGANGLTAAQLETKYFENKKIADGADFAYNDLDPDLAISRADGTGTNKYIGVYKKTDKLVAGEWFLGDAPNNSWYHAGATPWRVYPTEAYLKTTNGASVRIFVEEPDGTVTALNGVDADINGGADAIYNVAGQRVSKAQKGIYIQNGKKVLVK